MSKHAPKCNENKQKDTKSTTEKIEKTREKYKRMHESVCDFFHKDDNTRILAAKKDHVGNEQKRFLLHPMKILHTKFQSESNIPVSYTFFCRNHPTNVVIPILKNRIMDEACSSRSLQDNSTFPGLQ